MGLRRLYLNLKMTCTELCRGISTFCSLQKKLEQLLLKFPPEEVESKRWQKIADELGNRTAKQVALLHS